MIIDHSGKKKFTGTIDNNFTRLKGSWSSGSGKIGFGSTQKKHFFDFNLINRVPGEMNMKLASGK